MSMVRRYKQKKIQRKQQLPASFKPLLWWLNWAALDVQRDREDIIVSTLNEGSVDQWRWIRETYGDSKIKAILKTRLVTEFHPESASLTRLVFGIKNLRNARRSSYTNRP